MRFDLGRLGRLFLRVGVATYAGLCLLLFAVQRAMLYFPTLPGSDGPDDFAMEVPGATVRVSAFRRSGGKALLYFGGNAEDVAAALPEYAAAFPDRSVFALQYRSYGASTGKPSEAALHGDAQALFDKVRSDHADIVLVGRSLGSGLALRLAATEPDVRRLVLVTPYDSILHVARRKYPLLPVRWLLRDRYEAWRDAPRVKAPTLVLAASDDTVIPARHTQALVRHFAPGIVTVRRIAATTHDSIADVPAYWDALRAGG